jgi:predicted permease
VPVQVTGAVVSGNLFDVLGVHAIAGRTLRADDGRRTDALPIVVSERLVRAGVLNAGLESAVALDGTPYRLAGVMPDTFWFPDRETSYWLPLPELPPESTAGTATSVTRSSVARLGRGIDPVAAAARANAILSRSDDSPGRRLVAVESYPSLLRAPLRPSLVALQAASGGVLVLVCLNVGWLFGARARRLHQTFATMRALGARPAQVARTYLAAGLCVAAIAAPCAVLTGGVLLRAARTLDTGVFSRMADPTITWHVSAAAVVVTVLVSLVACLPFTWVLARSSHTTRSSGGADRRRGFVASLVLVVQLGLVVAVGGQAVLFGRVLLSFYRTNVGFGNTDFVVVSLRLRPGTPTEPAAQVARHRTLLDDFGRRGIRAAVSNTMPLTQSDLRNDLRPAWMNGLDLGMVRVRVVSPSYFRLTGIEPSSGRLLSAADAGSRRAMVNDTFASAASPPGQSVIGQRHGGQPWRGEFTISGTTPPIRQLDFHEPEQPEIYFLYEDFVSLRPDLASIVASRTYVMAETSGLASTVGTVHEAIGRHLPDMDIRSTSHMRDLIGLRIGPGRLLGAGAAVFAAVALLLVATGLYGVVSHGLALRTREIGLRLALGATPGRVVLESVRPIVLVALTGSVAGALLLWSSWSALQSILIPPAGVAYPSPIGVVGLTTGLLCAAVVAAAWKPVRLAAATDPASALRAE